MTKIETYQSDLGEKASKAFIERCWNLELVEIPKKRNQQTPDYEIKDENKNVVAISEIKSCVDSSTSENSGLDISPEKIYETSQKAERNHRSKLEKHHNKAVSQLTNYSDFPSIIFFVSFDMTDHIDMDRMLQEQVQLHPSSPMADIYVLFKVHQSIIPSDTFEIKKTPQFRYNTHRGKNFLDKHLSLTQALKNKVTLPLVLNT